MAADPCSQCGNTVDRALTFCWSCGSSLATTTKSAPTASWKSSPPPSQSIPPQPATSHTPPRWNVTPPTPQPPPPLQPSWPNQPAPQPFYSGVPLRTLPLANTALWCGIGSLFCFGMILGVFAVVAGIIALNQIAAQPTVLGGKSRAGWGIALGILGALFWIGMIA
jgi:hypothetical protein